MKLPSQLRTFKHSIFSSFTNLNYYVEVLNASFKFSFKMSFAFYVLLGIAAGTICFFKFVPELRQKFDQTRSEFLTYYPDNLSFTWQNQKLISSIQEPITVHFPSSFPPAEGAPKNFMYINTTTDQPPESISASFYLNQKDLYYNSLRGIWTPTSLVEILGEDAQTVDKNRVTGYVTNAQRVEEEFLSILPILIFLSYSIGLFIIRFILISVFSIVFQSAFQLMNKPLSYKKVLQLSLHIAIPAELMQQYSNLFMPGIQFPMFSFTYWVLSLLLLWHLRHLHVLRFEKKDIKKS